MRQKESSYKIEKIKPTSSRKLSAVIGRCLLWIPNHLWAFAMLIFITALVFYLFFAPNLGKFAGVVMGSFEGVTSGIEEGAKAGKESGLSAEDMEVRIGTEIKAEGKLQVLLVDLELSDIYQEGKNYAVLYSSKGEGVFTVDLSDAKVISNDIGGKITIEIPEPEFELYPDDRKVTILDEYQSALFNGASKDGYTGYLNSREKYEEKVEEEIVHNDVMMEQAKSSALQQVEALAKAICGNETIEILFSEGKEEEYDVR